MVRVTREAALQHIGALYGVNFKKFASLHLHTAAAFLTQTVQLDDCIVRFEVRAGGVRMLRTTLYKTSGRWRQFRMRLITNVECRNHPAQLWDTAGQERYRSLAPMYYRGASAAVVVFDVTSRDSFEGAKSWVKELQRRGDPNVVIALAGNKVRRWTVRDKVVVRLACFTR